MLQCFKFGDIVRKKYQEPTFGKINPDNPDYQGFFLA